MKEIVQNSVFFGAFISLAAYSAGLWLQKKGKNPLLNPLLISVILVIGFLLASDIPYQSYYEGAKYLGYLLTPATVCLAIPLYEQMIPLKKNLKAILVGVFSGMMTSLCTVLLLSVLFKLGHSEYVTLLPKSVTTAIGMGLSKELGGYPTLTVAAIAITGIMGNVIAPSICRLFKIQHPVAVGIAIGSASHAAGTAKAIEMGELQGAMSSLSIAISGLMTVVGATVFSYLY